MNVPAALLALLLAVSAFLLPVAARAEPVAVNQAVGQGFVFNHRGNCYLILPQHVHGRQTRVSLVTAAPSLAGEARIFRSFAGADLSIGLVLPGLEDRCRDRWSDLPDAIDGLLDGNGTAILVRLAASGQETRLPLRIILRDLETLAAEPQDASRASEIFQGTSGSIASIGGTPIGMAVESRNIGEVTLLRMDEIKARLARLLESGSAVPEEEETSEAAGAGQCPRTGIALRSVVCSREPVSPELGCSNLAGGSGAALMPPGRFDMVVELDVDSPVPLAQVQIHATPEDGRSAAPKSIRIEIDSSSGRSPRWRSYASGDMTPFGSFSAENGAKPFARRLRVSVDSSWDGSLPQTIGCLAAR